MEDDADGLFDIARVYVHNTTSKQRHDDLEAVMTKRLCALNPPPHADQVVHDLQQTRNGGNLPAAIVDSTRPGIDKKASTAALEMAEDMAGNKKKDLDYQFDISLVAARTQRSQMSFGVSSSLTLLDTPGFHFVLNYVSGSKPQQRQYADTAKYYGKVRGFQVPEINCSH
ncbi:hypothetical protein LZ32DRAFT_617612 [Colletotrichum eremochloae]|nr:hypothetical protein LZ32DRAFT_617612 [Colletotrichum eremochloae]